MLLLLPKCIFGMVIATKTVVLYRAQMEIKAKKATKVLVKKEKLVRKVIKVLVKR